MTYSYERLNKDYPQVVQALASGLRRGQISGPTVVPHVGISVRRWFIDNDGLVIVETGWNNDNSSFDYYQAS